MERLIHESRETLMALLVASCLAAGIGGAAFYTLGPEGWLVDKVRVAFFDPTLSALVALLVTIGALSAFKRLLDRYSHVTALNNLLLGAVGLGGLVVLLQGVRTVIG